MIYFSRSGRLMAGAVLVGLGLLVFSVDFAAARTDPPLSEEQQAKILEWEKASVDELALELGKKENAWGALILVREVALGNEAGRGKHIRDFIETRRVGRPRLRELADKADALRLLGITNSEADREVLLRLYTAEGARALFTNWKGGARAESDSGRGEYMVEYVRGRAGAGLALTQVEAHREMLRKDYEAVKEKFTPAQDMHAWTDEEWLNFELLGFLVDALAYGDVIDELGRAKFKTVYASDMMHHLMMSATAKY